MAAARVWHCKLRRRYLGYYFFLRFYSRELLDCNVSDFPKILILQVPDTEAVSFTYFIIMLLGNVHFPHTKACFVSNIVWGSILFMISLLCCLSYTSFRNDVLGSIVADLTFRCKMDMDKVVPRGSHDQQAIPLWFFARISLEFEGRCLNVYAWTEHDLCPTKVEHPPASMYQDSVTWPYCCTRCTSSLACTR